MYGTSPMFTMPLLQQIINNTTKTTSSTATA